MLDNVPSGFIEKMTETYFSMVAELESRGHILNEEDLARLYEFVKQQTIDEFKH